MKEVNELIRGELAAVKSFDTVLQKIDNDKEKSKLVSMREDHVRAVDTLKKYAKSDFKEEEQSAGPWGAFTKAFAGGASLFGDKAAISALKVGEEHGIQEYKEALNATSITQELKEVIRSELLPNQERHISTINSYLQ